MRNHRAVDLSIAIPFFTCVNCMHPSCQLHGWQNKDSTYSSAKNQQ